MNYNDLSILLHSNISLIVVETFDETRALTLLQKYFRDEGIASWRWSVTDGMQPLGFGLQIEEQNQTKPEDVLLYIKKNQKASAFVLCDLHPYLDEPKMVRLLKDIALNQMAARHKVVLVSHRLKLPPEVARYGAVLQMSLPTEEEILALIREEAKSWSDRNGGERIKTDNLTLQKLVGNLKGLPHQDVRRLARGAIVDDGAISETDLPEVAKAKFALMDMEGVLHFEFSTAHLKDIAGLNRLKRWLNERKSAMLGQNGSSKIDPPKGVLLFGVQGGGKSLAAKAIAGIWGLPLLRLDMAAVYNKYVGETERNLREALKLADVMAPCVLWIDEIEKGLAQNDGENATSKRLLGSLLTWMAERKSRVFLVATSNDISVLPPELMRKGRFDEIFFVDLPDTETRRVVFEIHMEKRGLSSCSFDINDLAAMTEGFTGAEVEQAVVSAMYSAMAREEELSNSHFRDAIANTKPLSVIMAERMTMLRLWAAERAVPAN